MHKRRGVALMTAMLALMVLSTLVWIFVNVTHQAWFASRRMTDGIRAYYAAEGGIRYYLADQANWSLKRQVTLPIGESQTVLSVAGLSVSSVGTYRGAHRSIVLILSADGAVLSRSER
jgi:hypothetical protein